MTTDNAIAVLRRMQDPDPFEPQITQVAFDALEMAIQALSSKGDMVYRQATIDTVVAWTVEDKPDIEMPTDLIDRIKNMPSAQPEQAVKDCRNCKYGKYNDYHDTYFCYNAEDCSNWDKWETSAQPEQQWIPCSEPPETNENVFIARGNENFMSCCIGHYDLDAETWYEDRNWFAKILYDALYWCKMPTLPDMRRGEADG